PRRNTARASCHALAYRSRLCAEQMYTPFEEHVEKTTGCFRSLPVTARLRSKFFITFGGPQGHGHSVEKRLRVCSRAARASLRSRFRSGRRPRFSSPWVARQGHGDSLPVTARNRSGRWRPWKDSPRSLRLAPLRRL